MKKMLKLFAAFAMISLVISFAGCDLETEDELLETVAENPATPGNTGSNGTGSSGTGSNNNTGGTGTGGSGSNTENSGSSSTSPLWSLFDGADMQVWEGTAMLEETDDGLEITIGSAGWWGMCFCNAAAVGPAASDCVTFDMSNIAKITFEAKASEKASIWASQSNAESKPTNQTKIDLTTSYETKTFTLKNPGKKDYGVLDIGGGDLGTTTKSDVVVYIKNIKFFNASGAETVPARNE